MPEMPKILIIPPRRMDGSDRLEERLEDSEGNGEERKKAERNFDEKML